MEKDGSYHLYMRKNAISYFQSNAVLRGHVMSRNLMSEIFGFFNGLPRSFYSQLRSLLLAKKSNCDMHIHVTILSVKVKLSRTSSHRRVLTREWPFECQINQAELSQKPILFNNSSSFTHKELYEYKLAKVWVETAYFTSKQNGDTICINRKLY